MRSVCCFIWFCAVPAWTLGAIVYDFDTGSGVGIESDPGLSVSNFSGIGVSGLEFSGLGNPTPGARGHGFHVGANAANSNSYYFEISLGPNVLLELTKLSFDEFAEDGPGANEGPSTWQIRVNGTVVGSPQATNFDSYGSTHNIDLSFLRYVGGIVRVEFHGWGAANNNDHNEWFIDNVNLGFTTSTIPEPSTSLLLIGSIGCCVFRRRRTSKNKSLSV